MRSTCYILANGTVFVNKQNAKTVANRKSTGSPEVKQERLRVTLSADCRTCPQVFAQSRPGV